MKLKIEFCILMALIMVAKVFAKSHYLKEKPDFIKTCNLMDGKLNSCFLNNFQEMFRQWRQGVPGLKSVGTIDPVYIKRIVAPPIGNNPLLDVKIEMTKVAFHGLSDAIIKDLNFDFPNGHISSTLKLPKIKIESDYNVKGRLLNLPLDGSGDSTSLADDIEFHVDIYLKLRDEFQFTFTDIKSIKLKLENVGNFHIDLRNLFNGQKELEDSTNEIINQSWREFFVVLQSPIEEAVQVIMADRVGKIFSYVPANYFISDIPTAAEHYG